MSDDVFMYEVTIAKEHPGFAGHFPGAPVLPAVAQLGLLEQAVSSLRQRTCMLTGVPSAKFLSPIMPGMHVCIALVEKQGDGMDFTIRSDEQIVAKGRLCYKVVS